ncbi:hypothetical protein ACFQFC_39400 [Amorphoplanes digitatis]|uniref:Uncharacterized protein n=1 Tax=Actinoplanes digitatis TaxID=1868 RepID=A0A7W7HWX5_9ACTN|nr:hypothetical protein [Actinoplanes digitatis]MBB4762239.1 hypothetical protein [Actinoplanes digitatis]BFE71026.1 hypothetical protein GCM10020092_043270 [Actinoplanes digitatis]GID92640.1 hypothetical protein Adi01nite_20520 [Actinoplanes digitatis]
MRDFAVHVDSDEMARQDMAGSVPELDTHDQHPAAATLAHHGADDIRQAARQRSERDRAGRATGGSGRSYAFRRS